MKRMGKAVIQREPGDAYSLAIFETPEDQDEFLKAATTAGSTLANAFNSARDALAAMAVSGEKHQKVVIVTHIK